MMVWARTGAEMPLPGNQIRARTAIIFIITKKTYFKVVAGIALAAKSCSRLNDLR